MDQTILCVLSNNTNISPFYFIALDTGWYVCCVSVCVCVGVCVFCVSVCVCVDGMCVVCQCVCVCCVLCVGVYVCGG